MSNKGAWNPDWAQVEIDRLRRENERLRFQNAELDFGAGGVLASQESLRRQNAELAAALTKVLEDNEAVGDTLDEVCPGWQGDYSDVIRALVGELDELAAALQWWIELTQESKGVAGWHLNGDIALWSEFDIPGSDSAAILAAHDAAKDAEITELSAGLHLIRRAGSAVGGGAGTDPRAHLRRNRLYSSER